MTIDERTYGFAKTDAEELLQLIGGGDSESPEIVVQARNQTVWHAYTPSGGIPARSTLTMGSASCDVYACSTAGVLSDSGRNVTVYNFASSDVAGSTHILIEKNNVGLWICIAEDCG